MSDDIEEKPDWKALQQAEFEGVDNDHVVYDFFKTMTSLCVLTLGGILTLSESVFGDRLSMKAMFLAAGFVAAAGIVSLQCMVDIVHIRRGRQHGSHWLRWGDRVAPGLLGGGIGAFMVLLYNPELFG